MTTNEFIYEQKQTHREQTSGCQGEGLGEAEGLGVWY